MDRIPPQYDYYNTTDEPWLSDNVPITNESSSGSDELYSTFTTPVSPDELAWYYEQLNLLKSIVRFLLK